MEISSLLKALYGGRQADALALAETYESGLPLIDACALGDEFRVLMCLQAGWGSVNDRSPDGFAPLHLAAYFGRFNVVKVLIENRADVSSVSDNPMALQPLHAACAAENKDEKIATALAASLIRAGADPNATQVGGFTPLRAARQNGWPYLEKLLVAAGATA